MICFTKKCVVRFERYIKFGIVGGFGCLINWSILYCLTEYVSVWYIASSVIGIIVAATNNYVMNHYWTFRKEQASNKNMWTGWLKYQVANGLCSLIYLGMLAILTEVCKVWYMASAVIAVMISSTFMFLSIRRIVWRKRETKIEMVSKS